MKAKGIWARIGALVVLAMQLSACLTEEVQDPVTMSIALTNPADASEIMTPDVVINITGTVDSEKPVDVVQWRNDRGGSGTASGTANWSTGNIILQVGVNNVSITAIDTSGSSVTKTLMIDRENTAALDGQPASDPAILFSYDMNLLHAAPVDNAAIFRKPTFFFVDPGDAWREKGISSIDIECCKGISGPGSGDDYDLFVTMANNPFARQFDLSAMDNGGTRRIRYRATFNDGTESSMFSAEFTVSNDMQAQNSAPVFSAKPRLSATVGTQYSFRPMASDPDGDTIRFSIVNKPSWAVLNPISGHLYGTPTAADVGGTTGIVLMASDGKATTRLPEFSIIVEAFSTGSANLRWSIPERRMDNTPLDNLAGYNIYYGQTSGDYGNRIRVTNSSVTEYLISNLSPGNWHFVITAVDLDGLESNPSNEATKSL